MKRVQHDEVKRGMKSTGPITRWVAVHEVIGHVLSGPHTEAHAKLMVSYVNGEDKRQFQLNLYVSAQGYELHPQAALIDAQEHQRKGRADFVKNLVLREYSIKLAIVDRVDNEGVICGYCQTNTITTNVYATVTTESGRAEESAWSTCTTCTVYSLDQVEDVDPSHTITIERTAL